MGPRNKKKRIGDMLIDEHMLTEEQLERGLAVARDNHRRIGEVLVELGYVTEERIAKALSRQMGIDIVNLNGLKIDEAVLSLAGGELLRKHIIIPFAYAKDNMNVVRVAMADPMDMNAIDDFCIVSNMQVEPAIATTREIMMAIDRYYGDSEMQMAAEQYAREREQIEQSQQEDSFGADENSLIVQMVRKMIERAARQRASDVHIEALEKEVRVRFRIDGVLYERETYDIHLLPALIARIKIISGMDIAEKRKPQDGRMTMVIDRKEYDIRASMLPTVYGEKCVLRLAEKKLRALDKSELGFTSEELTVFDQMLKHPNGIILVTGPTGSGKSTTMYTALQELNREGVNIITVEDPVESGIAGVNQVQVNPKADLTFANALRSILRQDPDIIMIGEIRDTETAEIAVQASITGHLVMSTLHTNSAAGTITRLIDMGVESYLLADAIIGVIAQRLVRKLCPKCKTSYQAEPEEKRLLGVSEENPVTLYRPCGCANCNNTGYVDRIGVYEMMKVTPELKMAISHRATTQEIAEIAGKQGMHNLHMSAASMVLKGITSMSEMLHITFES